MMQQPIQKKEPKLLFKSNNVSQITIKQQRGKLMKSSIFAPTDSICTIPRDYSSFNRKNHSVHTPTSSTGKHSDNHSSGSTGNYYHNFRVRTKLQKKLET